ncbi:exported protein of unknown function (plasmid) [Azospirillum baldaniorum]|uniref:6-phosphogluconate dehydrogenase NADP-binding domain-containing protein n=1 Tax=Azospirillum baldaniorum TaxID=1064539 RepID=A0A9P1JYT7_9PROT|nr:exported protein of unknown function [Azospirillum baldaniorum]
MTTVGFIGLGSMGMPMACNLLARGFALRGFDVRRESVAVLEARGGRGADSAAAAAEGADALVLMVVNAAQAESVLFAQGALDRLPEGATVILMATCPPDAVAVLAARVEAAGRRFVDAPVSGGTVGAGGRNALHHGGGPGGDGGAGAPGPGGDGRQGLPRRRGAGARRHGEDGQPAAVRRPHRRGGGSLLAGRQGRRRSGGPAGDHERLRRVELDAEGPRPAHAGGRTGHHQRRGHFRQGSRHRPGGRSRRQGRLAAGRRRPPDVPLGLRARRGRDGRQPGDPQLSPAQRRHARMRRGRRQGNDGAPSVMTVFAPDAGGSR